MQAEAVDLIKQLLVLDPTKRLGANVADYPKLKVSVLPARPMACDMLTESNVMLLYVEPSVLRRHRIRFNRVSAPARRDNPRCVHCGRNSCCAILLTPSVPCLHRTVESGHHDAHRS